MRFAFCIFKYFPHGGLQQDFLRTAQECCRRGHAVHLYAAEWRGPRPPDMDVTLVPVRAFSNHRKYESFGREMVPHLMRNRFDAVVGFNRIPGLDVYFAGDGCFKAAAERKYGLLSRWFPRQRVITRLERCIFTPAADTLILYLTGRQNEEFVLHYGTPENRLHQVPPCISRECSPPRNGENRIQARKRLGLKIDGLLLLFVGSDFRAKGLDRAVRAVASLPRERRDRTSLLVLGGGRERRVRWLARSRGIADRVRFLGPRADVYQFYRAADLLLHPTRREAAGKVLLEAIASGLPVLTTSSAGYSFHVERSGAGTVLQEPFVQSRLNAALARMLSSTDFLSACSVGAREYSRSLDFHSGIGLAADMLEDVAERKCSDCPLHAEPVPRG